MSSPEAVDETRLREVFGALAENHVEYAVLGVVALGLHGLARAMPASWRDPWDPGNLRRVGIMMALHRQLSSGRSAPRPGVRRFRSIREANAERGDPLRVEVPDPRDDQTDCPPGGFRGQHTASDARDRREHGAELHLGIRAQPR